MTRTNKYIVQFHIRHTSAHFIIGATIENVQNYDADAIGEKLTNLALEEAQKKAKQIGHMAKYDQIIFDMISLVDSEVIEYKPYPM